VLQRLVLQRLVLQRLVQVVELMAQKQGQQMKNR
jgi:hypothetical protein